MVDILDAPNPFEDLLDSPNPFAAGDPLDAPNPFAVDILDAPNPFQDTGALSVEQRLIEGSGPLGRIAERGVAGAERGLRLDEPIGPTEEELAPLRDIGLITPGPIGTFNELLLRSGAEGFDLIERGLSATINAAAGFLGQTARELGIVTDDTDQKKFERDINEIAMAALLVTGMEGMTPIPRARIRRNITKDVGLAIEKQFPEASSIAKETLKQRVEIDLGVATEEALLASAQKKIGQPTLGGTKAEAQFSFTQKVVTDTLDALAPIKFIAEREAKRLSEAPDLVPYRDMRLVAGLDGVIEAVFKKGTLQLDKAGNVTFRGKPLNDVFGPVSDDLTNVNLYFAGRRARELEGRGIEQPFLPAELSAMVESLETRNPALRQAFNDYQVFNREILDFAEQSGLLSAETKARFTAAGQDYVPFYRLVTDEAGKPKVKASVFKRLKGGTANLNEITDNITRNAAMWLDAATKNRAKVQVYDMIERFGLEEVAVRIKKPPESALIADNKIEAALTDIGLKKPGEGIQVFTYPRIVGDNIDSVYRNGKRVLYEIKDPTFLKAMTAFSPESLGLSMRVVAGFSNVLRRGVTLSPDFMVVNLIRDTQAAFLQTRGNYLPVVDAIRGMASRLTKDDNYWNMLANGGGFATLYRGETMNLRNLEKIYNAHGIKPSRVLDTPKKLMAGLEEISSVFEQASRISEFRDVAQRTGNLREAAIASREVSTDFALRGSSREIRNIAMSVPFLNARAQGLSQLVRTTKRDPAKLAVKAITAMTIPSIALYMINKDDPRYQALPNFIKDLHWVIFLPGSDDPFLIPKGFEYGALFATIPERFMEAIETRHGKAFANALGRMFLDTFSFNPTPQAVKPVLDAGVPFTDFLGFNRKFTGAPVVPSDLEKVRPSEQFRPYTSETMVALAAAMREEGIEMSPIQAESLVIGYLGTLGMYALSASDSLVRAASGKGEAPDIRLDEMMVMRRFIRQAPLRGTQFEVDAYELIGESRMIAATVNKMVKEGRDPDLTTREDRVFALIAPRETGPAPLAQIADIAARITRTMRLIEADTEMSGAEKRRKLDKLQEDRNKMFFGLAKGLPEDVLRERGFTVP